MVTIEELTAADGVRVRLLDRDVASFAIVFEDGNLTAIGHVTTDFACAKVMYRRAVVLAEQGRLVHPDWKRPSVRTIPINSYPQEN